MGGKCHFKGNPLKGQYAGMSEELLQEFTKEARQVLSVLL
jgi:hypothetical protein